MTIPGEQRPPRRLSSSSRVPSGSCTITSLADPPVVHTPALREHEGLRGSKCGAGRSQWSALGPAPGKEPRPSPGGGRGNTRMTYETCAATPRTRWSLFRRAARRLNARPAAAGQTGGSGGSRAVRRRASSGARDTEHEPGPGPLGRVGAEFDAHLLVEERGPVRASMLPHGHGRGHRSQRPGPARASLSLGRSLAMIVASAARECTPSLS
jgi:hypothetical protein